MHGHEKEQEPELKPEKEQGSGQRQLELRRAGEADCRLLACMNKELIEDEGSTNPMNPEELEERMRGFLRDGWTAELFQSGASIVGYVLYRTKCSEYAPYHEELYIRQYYINRIWRGQGFGRAGMDLLMRERAGAGTQLVLDVLVVNEAGIRFWRSLGFRPYYTNMRRLNGQ
jgi:ribosomal protein S18 acetylase RimI-like enzyme